MITGPFFAQLMVALAAALIGGALALALRQSVILGFLVAGLVLSPFTPGLVAPVTVIDAVADVGIIFLMFAVGVQLSLRELLRVSKLAIVGGTTQVLAVVALGAGAGMWLGFGAAESLVFGAVLSNSSSTVLSKVLVEHDALESAHGRIALAWSSVQDISTIAFVALFSVLSPAGHTGTGTWLPQLAFLILIVPAALWALPWLFGRASVIRSREIFILLVATVALGMAWTASQLGVSLALGAFLGGVAVGESPTAHRILGDALPLRDIFSGIFFVSIGMSIDPVFVLDHGFLVAMAVGLTVLGKGLITAVIAKTLGANPRTALLIGAGLAQSAEFSFLMARIGRDLDLVGDTVFGVMLSSAALSIVLAPFLLTGAERLAFLLQRTRLRPEMALPHADLEQLRDHAIVCGHGRVGSVVSDVLSELDAPLVVIDEELRIVEGLRKQGRRVLMGDAAQAHVLERAGLKRAALLVICIPERMAVRRIVEHANMAHPGITILARTHSESERKHLCRLGLSAVVIGELELGLELGRRAARALDLDDFTITEALDRRRGATAS